MKIHICGQCGVGMVGRRRCPSCSQSLFSIDIARTVGWAFLMTMGVHMLGMTGTSDYSVLGQEAYQSALIAPLSTPLVVELDPDAAILKDNLPDLSNLQITH